jgi:tetratricopeptide (TPR) repeat protein
MVTKSPNKPRVQHNFALALLTEGRAAEALIPVKRALELDDSIHVQWALLGSIQEELGNYEESVAAYRAALDIRPDNVKTLLGLGKALEKSARGGVAYQLLLDAGTRLARSGRPFEAMPLLESASSLEMADAGVHLALGNTYVTAGMSDRALEQYRLAVAIDTDMVSAWYNLGSTADSLGHTTEAIRAYEEFVLRAPEPLQQQILTAKLRIEALRASSGK